MDDPYLEQFEARRKEREAADRTFTLLGEELTVKASVAPEVGLEMQAFKRKLVAFWIASSEAERTNSPVPAPDGVTDPEMLELSESVIRACLTADTQAAWDRLRSPDAADPLTLPEIYGLADFVLSKASGLPTAGPSGSSDGPKSTKPRSRAKSPSTAAGRKH